MAKYSEVIYYENGVRKMLPVSHFARADKSPDLEKIAWARTRELLEPGEEFPIFPRASTPPHFFAKSEVKRHLDTRKESDLDTKHDERVCKLLAMLVNPQYSQWKIGTLDFGAPYPCPKELIEFTSFAKLDGYFWGKEVVRPLLSNVRARHDLFGAPSGLAFSALKPWIAIEVIHHHWPDRQTFDGMLRLSAELPLIILFDFIQKPNYFMELKPDEKQLRVIVYIRDGKVCKNGAEATVQGKIPRQWTAELFKMCTEDLIAGPKPNNNLKLVPHAKT